jgi:hypothetical protein
VGVGEVGGFAQSKMADLQMGKMDNLPADKLRPAGQDSCEMAKRGDGQNRDFAGSQGSGPANCGFLGGRQRRGQLLPPQNSFPPHQNNLQVGI